ncbi:TPA: LOW QUALITY PROTEIN: hypothetical protein N0F65_003021 [Lagenidium giganteum]|uniref:Ig-like domain-containing protein n=1 Tax=Lagenidium giganteum TaxID=4803 RepID=A0AAV2YRH5_9STRA|nr:TPA: LOW QUALITY PROTEIN: hypothetical protein N0F65_003021 [Lagenidium giganteum]
MKDMKTDTYTAPMVRQRLRKYLQDFALENGNESRVFVKKKGIARYIALQTAHMAKMFDAFLERDHDTNNVNYKLLRIMNDAFGHGQYLQLGNRNRKRTLRHPLLENEQYDTLMMALESFTDNNPRWRVISCVVIDKGLGDIRAEEGTARRTDSFVSVTCEEVSAAGDDKYQFSRWEKNRLRGAVAMMIKMPSKEKYKSVKNVMYAILPIGTTASAYHRCSVSHLGNNTNNREVGVVGVKLAENTMVVNHATALDECVVGIMIWQKELKRGGGEDVNEDENEDDADNFVIAKGTIEASEDEAEP